MKITERQKEILNTLIGEYISSAEPVSSQLLEEKYDFSVCPATIRNEMQKLTDDGYLSQPHTSAGRVPTDKGYRFYVNELLEKKAAEKNGSEEWINREIDDTINFVQSLSRNLAFRSSALVMSYLEDENLFWKEGWEEVLKAPEFEERDAVSEFTELVKSFEKEIKEMEAGSDLQVFIGKENPFSKTKNFSAILTRCKFPKREEGIVAIIGPKRMDYEKNIRSLNNLINLMKDF